MQETLEEWNLAFNKSLLITGLLVLTYKQWAQEFKRILRESKVDSNVNENSHSIIKFCISSFSKNNSLSSMIN